MSAEEMFDKKFDGGVILLFRTEVCELMRQFASQTVGVPVNDYDHWEDYTVTYPELIKP